MPSIELNPDIFREYDIRGLADTELASPQAELLGRTLGHRFAEAGRRTALVGRDNRPSSPRLRDALVAGLTRAGLDVLDLGVAITPMVYHAAVHLGVDAGCMITASHNPPEYNGVKVLLGPSTLYGAELQGLRELAGRIAAATESDGDHRGKSEHTRPSGKATAGASRAASSVGAPGAVRTVDAETPYLDMLCDKIRLERPLRVVLDCGNGTAGYFAERFFERLGCPVIPLFCEPDGRFPNHLPDPVKTSNLAVLRDRVVAEGTDCGIGFDGDADRIGVVDEKGAVIWGDKLMVLFWKEILERHPGAQALVEVKCSQALVDEIIRLGGKPEFTKTGHSLIKAKMREVGAVFAGEMSGHMFFADEYYGYDDAFYAAGRMLRILSRTREPLSSLLADIPRYFSTGETRVPCPDRAKLAAVAEITQRFKRTHQVIDVDGARVVFADGWALVRASNTQPVIVTRCEAQSEETLGRICDLIKSELERIPDVGEFDWES